ncbi:hypothetical protein OSC52_13575 [Clostridium pasteurianum]|uniref:hypothetical protein n=1 Tax=Clostridium pasteurianum TaxID=1501 RepID=UPI00226087AE|nr:hypothetical protein [Clostridium pasteurianum]UZW12879.1 hypothetical protein OSC52_13575 [Clostridium pasteurianum]
MIKKKIAIIIVPLLIVCVVAGLIMINRVKVNSTANVNQKVSGNLKYEVKKEIKEDKIKKEEAVSKSEFEIKNVQKENGALIVQINAGIDNEDEAYKMAVFLEQNITNQNKDKISKDGIKNIRVVILLSPEIILDNCQYIYYNIESGWR